VARRDGSETEAEDSEEEEDDDTFVVRGELEALLLQVEVFLALEPGLEEVVRKEEERREIARQKRKKKVNKAFRKARTNALLGKKSLGGAPVPPKHRPSVLIARSSNHAALRACAAARPPARPPARPRRGNATAAHYLLCLLCCPLPAAVCLPVCCAACCRARSVYSRLYPSATLSAPASPV
jgi:hypothetical protein